MSSNLPNIFNGKKICIICEGYEEYDYLEKLKGLGVWKGNYNIVLDNAKGNGNIPARYQDKYQNGSYDLVLVFCDTDRKPYEQYNDIKSKINQFHGNNVTANEVVIFGNPCTMQIVVEHWDEVLLPSHRKRKNASIIKKYTGVDQYNGTAEKRKQIFDKITVQNYYDMCERTKRLAKDDTCKGSTNFDIFMDRFSSENDDWIQEINDIIETEE